MLDAVIKFFKRRKRRQVAVVTSKPKHVAVIMDGNGRWANSQGMSRIAGHKRGVDSVKALVKSCISHEIPYLSIFAFSSENWNRSEDEVDGLMDLLVEALETQVEKLNEHSVRLKLIGDLSRFSDRIQQLAFSAQNDTQTNKTLTLNVAINYGGRWDITQACQKIAEKVASGELLPSEITEDHINMHISTVGIPNPDLYIRTSGEFRISNFLLWQAAYAEFYFTDILWPDFDEDAFTQALLNYADRERRFGSAVDTVTGLSQLDVVEESVNASSSFSKENNKKTAA